MRTVGEHQRVVAGLITARPAASVGLLEAEGLALAADVSAPLSLPMFDNSAMDGYAVRAEDIAAAGPESPVKLPVAEDIPAGRTDVLRLAPGTAHRIMTGAPVPAGATAVVPVEATDGGTGTVEIRGAARPGQHIRRAGEDVTAGTTVLRAGHVVTPAALGLAAALGLGGLPVVPRQRVLVLSTGSELVSAGTELKPGQIYESNAIMLAAAVREAGAEVVAMPTTSDDVTQFSEVLAAYAERADLIITSGGVSAGAYEVVKDAFGAGAAHGRRPSGSGAQGRRPSGSSAQGRRPSGSGVEFVKVAMQPGMPQGAGRVGGAAGPATSGLGAAEPATSGLGAAEPATSGLGAAGPATSGLGTPIVTLPGNPVSALVSFEVFVRPALRAAMGLPDPDRPRRRAVLAESLTSPGGRRQFRRGVYDAAAGTVTAYGPPASHHLRWLASANCLLEIPEEVTGIPAGDHVTVWDLT